MSKLGIEKGIIKVIDGELYYKSHYCYWLYTQLEEMQNRIDKVIDYIERKQEDINNGGNDMSYRQLTHLLNILRGNDEKFNE